MKHLFQSSIAKQALDLVEYSVEHLRRQPARVRVVARAVIAIDHRQTVAKIMDPAVAERYCGLLHAATCDHAVMRNPSKRQNNAHAVQ